MFGARPPWSAVALCAAVFAMLLASPAAHAGGKPPIAILGLEVHDTGTGVDPGATRAARELTIALRRHAKAGTGPFELVAEGDKELIDEKLLNNCDTEAPACMAAIGAGMGAEILVYGRVERSGAGYRVRLRLLGVSAKQVISNVDDVITLATGREPDAATLAVNARAWYGKLTAFTAGATVVVKTNVDRATVLLDDEARGTLSSGLLTLNKVSEGRHVLVIEAKDYQRYETPITVRNGETATHSATLVPLVKKPVLAAREPLAHDPISVEGTVARKEPVSGVWKPAFYASTGVALAGAGLVVLSWTKEKDAARDIEVAGITQKDCGSSAVTGASRAKLDSACNWHKANVVGWVITGAAGAAALGSFLMAFVRDREPAEATVSRGHRKRRELAITPIVTPDGGGATVRFDW